ncbi:cation diffusion facilitator 10 [Penicillium cinerascens]|uniref:Cation diffusion facilitator 10 n=1 Tax=Penicillium cinerascens TaxID=70096 RepID=A0A9W9M9H2_9EURO|nr:cation diffusion facilitator 10 [Penicillium cinerascens]KAJ5192037.1 cation diffusion facilitator 10 [Penicillium cinerascens]
MSSPVRRPSFSSNDDAHYHYPLSTHSGTLASLIRSQSQQSLTGLWRSPVSRNASDDEESGSAWGLWRLRHENEGIEHLLQDEARLSRILKGPQARSRNLLGKSNPRYCWERYWKHDDQLLAMKKPIRKYYERTNELIQQYMYIDCLLDSSIPHDLLNEYSAELEASAFHPIDVPATINEEPQCSSTSPSPPMAISRLGTGSYSSIMPNPDQSINNRSTTLSSNYHKPASPSPKRTPKDIFRSSESIPLLQDEEDGDNEPTSAITRSETGPRPYLSWLEDAEVENDDPIVTLAIWVNMIANAILLGGKIIVIISVPSMSILASLVDAMLDFLSTAIIWTTSLLISSSQQDQYRYPVGRRRLEPVGVLVFSIIMITSFVQVGLECVQRLASPKQEILELGLPAIIIMVTTIVIKGAVWIWCRLVKNSSPDERNLLLYLTMRFVTAIRQIQNLRAYHAGDKLFVEVDIVLSAVTPLKDSHDLSEVLTYFLESVPILDRTFVHVDYTSYNAPTHIPKQTST